VQGGRVGGVVTLEPARQPQQTEINGLQHGLTPMASNMRPM
jgi:hypothetical protein